MKISISKGNTKMGGIPSFSFPPVITCTNCEHCAKKCYALRIARRRPNVAQAYADNLDAWKRCPYAVRDEILQASALMSCFRYFVAGDIVDAAFFRMMVEIATLRPHCVFLAFTKNYNVVNEYISERGPLPKNLKIIFSEWIGNIVPNPHGLPTSRVIFKGDSAPAGAMVCGGNCAECRCQGVGCWTLKDGETIYFYEH